MARPRRQPLPKQGDRLSEALSEGLTHQHRRARAQAPPFDGDGVYKTDVLMLKTTTTTITHGLGRVPRGWLICAMYSTGTTLAPRIIEEVDTEVDSKTKRNDTTIQLHNVSVQDAWIDIWIY